jgi:hypothetical protein
VRSSRYRLAVAGRIVLAALGGYAVAAVATAFLSLSMPLAQSEAVTAATLASFAVMALVVCWVFAARSLLVAAAGLGLPLALLGVGLRIVLPAS